MAELTEKITTATTTSGPSPRPKKAPGLSFRRYFTQPDISPYDTVEWELRLAQITDAQGGVIFEQKDVEVPKDWSMTATNIAASKYLHGQLGTSERETGARQLIGRVAETIRDWGMKDGYFRTSEDAATFHDELAYLLLRQYAAFNSPVWFNVGCDRIEPNSDGTNWHWNKTAQRVEFGVVENVVRHFANVLRRPQLEGLHHYVVGIDLDFGHVGVAALADEHGRQDELLARGMIFVQIHNISAEHLLGVLGDVLKRLRQVIDHDQRLSDLIQDRQGLAEML